MQNRRIGRVEDYTNTCLVMFLVNLLWIFGVIWAYLGLPAVMILGVVLNHLINRYAASRA